MIVSTNASAPGDHAYYSDVISFNPAEDCLATLDVSSSGNGTYHGCSTVNGWNAAASDQLCSFPHSSRRCAPRAKFGKPAVGDSSLKNQNTCASLSAFATLRRATCNQATDNLVVDMTGCKLNLRCHAVMLLNSSSLRAGEKTYRARIESHGAPFKRG